MNSLTRRAFLGSCALPAISADSDVQLRANLRALEGRLPKILADYHVPGLSMAVIREGRIFWAKGFGVRDASSRAPVDTATVFEAQSMSKSVFAYVVMKLVEKRVLDLDAPLTKYTPERFVSDDPRLEQITARRVLSHTSGLVEIRSRAQPLAITFPPGERWLYSGEGYYYLQSVVTRLIGRTDPASCSSYEVDMRVCATDYAAFMNTLLLRPFGMRSSAYLFSSNMAGRLARRHDENGKPLDAIKPTAPDVARYGAMGGLLTTPSDFARFLIEVIAPRKPDEFHLNAATQREMLRPHVKIVEGENPSSWALGWQIPHKPFDLIAHGGDIFGAHCMSVASVARRGGFVVMTNGEGGYRMIQEQIMTDVARFL